MTDGGRHSFNGVHLRVETDAEIFFLAAGMAKGKASVFEAALGAYLDAMGRANFSASSPLYIATGLTSYANKGKWQAVQEQIRKAGLASKLLYKEAYTDAATIQGFDTEQLALLDFLILAHARQLVGLAFSTFSVFLREYRALHGFQKSTTRLVGNMTDLFEKTAIVVEDAGDGQAALGKMLGW
ncbi:hypothetical protein N2152v2_005978 [Parachlorella kessleri]